MSWAEAKWVVDQILQKTGQTPNNMREFSAYPISKTSIGLKFLEPADSYDGENIICTVGGVMIRMSEGSYPLTPTDGQLVLDNKELGKYATDPFVVDSLTEGTTYFFSAFPYSTQGLYNQSSNQANRASCAPADGEQVTVNVTIDDASGFSKAVVTCVDETAPEKTATYNITPLNRTAKFTVPIGHGYHIEFGSVDKYILDKSRTDTKIAAAGGVVSYDATYTYYTSTINVTYPVGATVTCTKGEIVLNASDISGSFSFKVHEAGTWTVKAVKEKLEASSEVVISNSGETKDVTLEFFTATIHVTFPKGATLTCKKDLEEYTGDTSGDYTFTVHEAGSWEVKAVLDDLEDSESVEISQSGDAKEVTLSFYTATIKVTYPVGATVTCEKGEKKYNAPDTSGSWTVEVHEAGVWTLKATQDDLSTEDTVTISRDGDSQSVTLAFFTSTIQVTYPKGAKATCVKGAKKYEAPDTNGSWTVSVHEAGVWTIKAEQDELSAEKTVQIDASGENKSVTLEFFTSTIHVTYPVGATVTCKKDAKEYTAVGTNGDYTFTVHESGTWVLKAVLLEQETTANVEITRSGEAKEVELSFSKVYGIERDTSLNSPTWTRTDSAVGKTATPTKGTVAGHSDFDDCMPWSGMKRTVKNGDTFVQIPKCYVKRWMEGTKEHIQIADKKRDGFNVHPRFIENGQEKDYIYVAAYSTSSGHKSVSGASPLVSQTRDQFRQGAKNRGAGYSLVDIDTLSLLQALILVEFADNNVQTAIGRGYCDSNSAASKTGTCDNVTNLTGIPAGTDGKVDVVWRGFEGLWGNVYEFYDGINMIDGEYYVCHDRSKYKDDTTEGYTKLSYKGLTTGSGYITKEGLDTGENSHIMLPTEISGGSETTGYCDYAYFASGKRVLYVGGPWNNGSRAGVFCSALCSDSSYSNSYIGSRLLYIEPS